jgi:RNA polymerase sigma factor (sigma-70 family)
VSELPDPRDLQRDPDAFEAFYRAHVRDVERFIARRVSDPQVAADLTADVFLALIQHASGYRAERGNVLAWVYGIARNVVAEQGRTRARDLRVQSRVRGRALLDDASLLRVEERLDAEAAARTTLLALAALGDADRQILELVAIDELSLEDAATHLRIEPGAARVRLHRARRRLASLLASDTPPILSPLEALT